MKLFLFKCFSISRLLLILVLFNFTTFSFAQENDDINITKDQKDYIKYMYAPRNFSDENSLFDYAKAQTYLKNY